MADSTTENTSNVLVAIMIGTVFLVVMLLATVIILDSVDTSNLQANGITYNYSNVNNETRTLSNSTLGGNATSVATLKGCQIVTMWVTNASNSARNVAASNYTINSPTGCYITGVDGATYTNLRVNLSYTYKWDTTVSGGVNVADTNIKDSIVGMMVNFFAMMPTVGTILAVVILIAAIVLLVMYVRRMKQPEQTDGGFVG